MRDKVLSKKYMDKTGCFSCGIKHHHVYIYSSDPISISASTYKVKEGF